MKPSYQLTKHPIGSFKEIWTISWPLMLGLLSVSFMMFADRLLLARYSLAALDASANAGMATYVMMILPLTIAGISEVLVGRYHGEGLFKAIGRPVWQMFWFSLFTAPFFWLAGNFAGQLFFFGTGNELLEQEYFSWILYFAPFSCATIALMGFFIGTGRVKIVTYSAIIANGVNILLALALIFGYGIIPSLGVKGAAIATGISQFFQMSFLLSCFLRSKYRRKYGTGHFALHRPLFLQCLRLGTPSGLGHLVEVLAHLVFFRIMIMAGGDRLTIVALVQSLYGLIGFLTEGVSKGVTTVVANLIGAAQKKLIGKVIFAAMKMQFLFFCIAATIVVAFTEPVISAFFSDGEKILLQSSDFLSTIRTASVWMCVFFLFEGFYWIFLGQLTAAGDTKFIFFTSLSLTWITCIIPVYYFIGIGKGGADLAWLLLAISSLLNVLVYLWRYQSGSWLKKTLLHQSPQSQ